MSIKQDDNRTKNFAIFRIKGMIVNLKQIEYEMWPLSRLVHNQLWNTVKELEKTLKELKNLRLDEQIKKESRTAPAVPQEKATKP